MANAATNWLLMSPDGHSTYTDGWLSICAFSMELDMHSKFSDCIGDGGHTLLAFVSYFKRWLTSFPQSE